MFFKRLQQKLFESNLHCQMLAQTSVMQNAIYSAIHQMLFPLHNCSLNIFGVIYCCMTKKCVIFTSFQVNSHCRTNAVEGIPCILTIAFYLHT